MPDKVREVDPFNGTELNAFDLVPLPFDVNFGDLEVSQATGNLFIASSSQTFIREMTASGTVVQNHNVAVVAMSGIAIDDLTGDVWITTHANPGVVYQFSGLGIPPLSAVPEPATLLLLGSGLAGLAGTAWRRHRRK